jgi:ArsR family transcriptional regulator
MQRAWPAPARDLGSGGEAGGENGHVRLTGEIDLLLADPHRGRLWVIEAKDALVPFGLNQILYEITDYDGVMPETAPPGRFRFKTPERAYMGELLTKTDDVRQQLVPVLGMLGINDDSRPWQVIPLIVTPSLVAASFAAEPKVAFTCPEPLPGILTTGRREPQLVPGPQPRLGRGRPRVLRQDLHQAGQESRSTGRGRPVASAAWKSNSPAAFLPSTTTTRRSRSTTTFSASRSATTCLAPAFKALGDRVRLQLTSMIASAPTGETCVCDLTPQFALSGPTISLHLKTLREAGLVDAERRGTWVYNRARPALLGQLAALLTTSAG